MIRTVQQGLECLAKRDALVAEGFDIGGQVKGLAQQEHLVDRHVELPLELHQMVKRDIFFQPERPGRHQNGPPRRGRIGRIKGVAVIRHPIAHRAEIAHIHGRDEITQKDRRDVLYLDVINAHDAAIGAGQVDAEMAIDRLGSPDHIHPAAIARPDDGRHFDDAAITGQRLAACACGYPADRRPVAARRITGDAH